MQHVGTDETGGTRVPQYPNGTAAGDQGDCCALCDATTGCTTWVFALPSENLAQGDVNWWVRVCIVCMLVCVW